MEEKQETKDVTLKTKKETEKLIGVIVDEGITSANVDYLYKLVDIHKDIANEDYWKMKEENKMRYRAYGRDSYGEGEYGKYEDNRFGRRMRDSRGRYMARGYDTKYQGEEMLGDMYQNYEAYSESKEAYSEGNYGAKHDSIKSLEYMLESTVDFMEMLKKDASSKEEMELIKKYSKKISDM